MISSVPDFSVDPPARNLAIWLSNPSGFVTQDIGSTEGMSDLLFPLHKADSLSLAEVSERTGIHLDTLHKKAEAVLVPGAFHIGVFLAYSSCTHGVRRRR
jgi:hypothetical protein